MVVVGFALPAVLACTQRMGLLVVGVQLGGKVVHVCVSCRVQRDIGGAAIGATGSHEQAAKHAQRQRDDWQRVGVQRLGEGGGRAVGGRTLAGGRSPVSQRLARVGLGPAARIISERRSAAVLAVRSLTHPTETQLQSSPCPRLPPTAPSHEARLPPPKGLTLSPWARPTPEARPRRRSRAPIAAAASVLGRGRWAARSRAATASTQTLCPTPCEQLRRRPRPPAACRSASTRSTARPPRPLSRGHTMLAHLPLPPRPRPPSAHNPA